MDDRGKEAGTGDRVRPVGTVVLLEHRDTFSFYFAHLECQKDLETTLGRAAGTALPKLLLSEYQSAVCPAPRHISTSSTK